MLRSVTVLVVILAALGGLLFFHYLRVEREREGVRHQLESEAMAAAISDDASVEHRAAADRGQMIAATWPVLWWENAMVVRSHVAAGFDKMVALKRQRFKPIPAPVKPAGKAVIPTQSRNSIGHLDQK